MEDISRLEKQLAELKSSKAEYEEPLQEAKIWETLIEKYAHAEKISEELADAMIESMQMNGDNSLSIQFRYMDSFRQFWILSNYSGRRLRRVKKCIAVYLRLSLEDVDKRTNQAKDESNSIAAQVS